jgi:hypothetical protein
MEIAEIKKLILASFLIIIGYGGWCIICKYLPVLIHNKLLEIVLMIIMWIGIMIGIFIIHNKLKNKIK